MRPTPNGQSALDAVLAAAAHVVRAERVRYAVTAQDVRTSREFSTGDALAGAARDLLAPVAPHSARRLWEASVHLRHPALLLFRGADDADAVRRIAAGAARDATAALVPRLDAFESALHAARGVIAA